jgi:aspartate aminotransferase
MNTTTAPTMNPAANTDFPILDIAASVRARRARGLVVRDFTLGDFAAPAIRMPELMRQGFSRALAAGQTSYGPPDGITDLRRAIARLYRPQFDIEADGETVLVQGGARPLLYAAYRTLVEPGEVVIDPVPSWNNVAYCRLVGARRIEVPTLAEQGFLPRAADLQPHLAQARLLVLSSPLNPTGTMYRQAELDEITNLVVAENHRRTQSGAQRMLYLLWDQVYWQLAFERPFVHPLALHPELRRWTIVVDAASKAYACTGVRVGWCVAPVELRARMSQLLSHVGSWAPTPAQMALLHLLEHPSEAAVYLGGLRRTLQGRTRALTDGLRRLRAAGWDVDVIEPEAGMFVAARLGPEASPGDGGDDRLRERLLCDAGVAVLPLSAFGMPAPGGWFRFSVGAITRAEIDRAVESLPAALVRHG